MVKNLKILLAEDDPNLGMILKSYLEARGYLTELCDNGLKALNLFKKQHFDFCIIDVMMPVKDGFTLAKEIKMLSKKVPMMFLTAKSMQDDVIEGLKIGVDDYMTKPFSMEELLLRMNAILKRTYEGNDENDNNVYKIGVFTFDYNRQVLIKDKSEQKLTSKEADLLRLLYKNKNNILDRTEALMQVWGNDSYFNARSMDVYMTKLRKHLKPDPSIEIINIHGKGFKLFINKSGTK
ncbi:MAG: Sensory transduction protein regX3 [Bacteroidetes bacterium ADurb.Bin408]|nr:MAG: Sensory transduction protein regX3 [Bacteroidetes bacterium ADurb.Bin408]